MTSDVITVSPETPLHEIAMLLEERRIKRVPIVNKDGNLVGIVSRANLIQLVASARPTLEMPLRSCWTSSRRYSWAHPHNLSVTVTNGVVDLWGYAKSGEERKSDTRGGRSHCRSNGGQ